MASDTVLAHITLASPADIDAVRTMGAKYALTIYPRRGVNPDLLGIQARGIARGFATDWMEHYPFEGMRNAVNALWLKTDRVESVTAAEALRLATLGSLIISQSWENSIQHGTSTRCAAPD